MIFSMSEAEFDAVIRVHLKGHFCGMRHAAAYLARQIEGRGWHRSTGASWSRPPRQRSSVRPVGQPNYAAAKAGIVAHDQQRGAGAGPKYGVTANT
jgi:NAD(P)-dependent dehydrogenase (short-subunit alcohol dehydrogenase family)